MSADDLVVQRAFCRVLLPVAGLYVIYVLFKRYIKRVHRRIFAWFMSKIAVAYNKSLGKRKQKLFTDMHDVATKLDRPLKVLEIGAGTGANFKFFPDGTEVVCIDPNPNFDSYLMQNVSEFPHMVLKKFVLGIAEDMSGVESESIDCVVCTLVLCSVEDVDCCLSEVKRVLRKGGKFYFMEHTRADKGTWIYTIQNLIAPIWKVLGDGCQFRESWNNVKCSGFSEVDLERFGTTVRGIRKWLPFLDLIRPHMMGKATK